MIQVSILLQPLTTVVANFVPAISVGFGGTLVEKHWLNLDEINLLIRTDAYKRLASFATRLIRDSYYNCLFCRSTSSDDILNKLNIFCV